MMTSIGPKAQGKSINRAALTESLLRYLLGFAALTPTYALASAKNQKILIPARLAHR
jgi:hypothetical protein